MSAPYYQDDQVTLHLGDALAVASDLNVSSVDCVVTSPPYFGLRDYGTEGQYGLESSPAEYVETMRALFGELRRVLAADGTLWLNLGDSYVTHDPGGYRQGEHLNPGGRQAAKGSGRNRAGTQVPDMPPKNLVGIPWRVAFALQDDGWLLRNAIIWNKPNAMPESVTDRLSGRYEHVFLFSRSRRYWFDLDPIREAAVTTRAGALTWNRETDEIPGQRPQHRNGRPRDGIGAPQPNMDATGERHTRQDDRGRNPGDVWTIPTQPFPAAHFAVMPVALAQRCILAGCKPGGTVLDPFSGSGTTGLAAQRTGRKYIGIDLSCEYIELSLRTRLNQSALDFGTTA